MRESIEARAMNVHVLFRNFDTDNSGTVDYEELKVGLEKVEKAGEAKTRTGEGRRRFSGGGQRRFGEGSRRR